MLYRPVCCRVPSRVMMSASMVAVPAFAIVASVYGAPICMRLLPWCRCVRLVSLTFQGMMVADCDRCMQVTAIVVASNEGTMPFMPQR